MPVFIWAPDEEGEWRPGGASQWWLHQSLRALESSLGQLGSRLVIRSGPTLSALLALAREAGTDAIFWNRRCEPEVMQRDRMVEEALRARGLQTATFNGALLHDPGAVRNQSGRPFQVFTPFWRACLAQLPPPAPISAPRQLPAPAAWPASRDLNSLGLEPKTRWADGLRAAWTPGEAGAQSQLKRFLERAWSTYDDHRDRPDLDGTSRLSPHLHFGEISPRQIWHGVRRAAVHRNIPEKDWRQSRFLAEIGWREFAHHLLAHFPSTPQEPLRAGFNAFPWRRNASWLRAWQQGRTGYPIVDAGMRQLWTTGWMHNRVRMIAASFLVKDLLLSWREGARWFWDTLVDADLAQNTLGWQWTAGCGADAAPYFRVFNPVVQGEKFDPLGHYVRRWCPELARLPDAWLHQPWRAPAAVLARSGLNLGRDYPEPIVSHAIAREVALEAFEKFKSAALHRQS